MKLLASVLLPAPRYRVYTLAPLALVVALGLGLALLGASAFSSAAVSRASGPPTLGEDFSLPFRLEQGRPPPARAASGPRQNSGPAATPAVTPVPQSTPRPHRPGPHGVPGEPTPTPGPIPVPSLPPRRGRHPDPLPQRRQQRRQQQSRQQTRRRRPPAAMERPKTLWRFGATTASWCPGQLRMRSANAT